MQMLRKRTIVSLFAACLLVALTFGSGVAFAADNTLTVTAKNNETLASDVSAGRLSLDVDVYQVAGVHWNAQYGVYEIDAKDLNVPFATSDMIAELEKALAGEGDWATLAEMAKAIVEKNPSKVSSLKQAMKISGAPSSELTVEDGMYLVVPHKAKVKLKDKERTYSFLPSLISLPSKYSIYYDEGDPANNPQGDVNSADPGEWNTQVTIAIKPQVKETPISTSKTKSSSKPSKPTRPSVKTGDDTNVVPFVVAMGVSGALLVGLFVYNRRTRKRDE